MSPEEGLLPFFVQSSAALLTVLLRLAGRTFRAQLTLSNPSLGQRRRKVGEGKLWKSSHVFSPAPLPPSASRARFVRPVSAWKERPPLDAGRNSLSLSFNLASNLRGRPGFEVSSTPRVSLLVGGNNRLWVELLMQAIKRKENREETVTQ